MLVIWQLDRLGRSVKGLIELVGELAESGVQFRSLTDGIDTTTPSGRFFFHMMASLAQMERELIAERTQAGLDAARRWGRVIGRKRRMTPGKVKAAKQLLGGGMPPVKWRKISRYRFRRCIDGCQLHPAELTGPTGQPGIDRPYWPQDTIGETVRRQVNV